MYSTSPHPPPLPSGKDRCPEQVRWAQGIFLNLKTALRPVVPNSSPQSVLGHEARCSAECWMNLSESSQGSIACCIPKVLGCWGSDLVGRYDASEHPDVISGRRTEAAVFRVRTSNDPLPLLPTCLDASPSAVTREGKRWKFLLPSRQYAVTFTALQK